MSQDGIEAEKRVIVDPITNLPHPLAPHHPITTVQLPGPRLIPNLLDIPPKEIALITAQNHQEAPTPLPLI